MSGIIATDFLSKGGENMDSCDSYSRSIYCDGDGLDYIITDAFI